MHVNNVAPTIAISGAASVNEGSAYSLTLGAVTDPGTDTVTSYIVHWGDGNTDTYSTRAASRRTPTPTGRTTTTITVDLVDEDGTFLDRANDLSVHVNNVAPTATFNNNGPFNEGSNINLSLTAPIDPSSVDTAAGFEYRFSCDNGLTWTVWASSNTGSCSTNDNGTRNVKGEIRDKDLDASTYSAAVMVNNVAPTAAIVGAPASSPEGTLIELESSFTDPGTADTHTFVWSVTKNGNPYSSGSSEDFSFTPNDNGSYVVTLTVTDDDGESGSDSKTIAVTNVAPTVTIVSGATSVDEGDVETYEFTVTDPGTADTWDFVLNYPTCGTNGTVVAGSVDVTAGGGSFDCRFPDGPKTTNVAVKVADDDAGVSADVQAVNIVEVTIANVAPTATFNSPATVAEGSDINLSLTDVVDPGLDDTHEYRFSCDGGTTWTLWSSNSTHACSTNDNGLRSVKGQVRDNNGGMSPEYSASVTVTNVAPTAAFNNNGPVNEGSNINLSLTAPSDPSSVDTAAGFEYRFSCDDGATWTAWASSNTGSCSTNDNGTRNVKGEIRDKDLDTSTYSAAVTVNNVAPTATFNNNGPVNQGSDINLSLTAPSDPSSVDTAAGFEYAFDCGSGYSGWSTTATTGCPTYDNGTRNVKGKIRDKDFDESEYTALVTINNVAPVVTAADDQATDEGTNESFELGTFVDPGADAPWSVLVSWGDSSTTGPVSFTPLGYSPFGSSAPYALPSLPHAYADNGTYTVTVTVTDKDSASHFDTFQVIVDNVAPSASIEGAPASSPEGTLIELTSVVTDPGTADTHTYEWSVTKNGNPYASGTDADFSFTPNDNGSYVVSLTVTDDDGGVGSDTATITVTNVAPDVEIVSGETSVDEGDVEIYTFTVTDPGTADTWKLREWLPDLRPERHGRGRLGLDDARRRQLRVPLPGWPEDDERGGQGGR